MVEGDASVLVGKATEVAMGYGRGTQLSKRPGGRESLRVWRMSVLDGHGSTEAGRIQGIPINTAKVHTFRVSNHVREKMGDEYREWRDG